MPFGLQGAPATFQRMMDVLLSDVGQFAAAYLNDVIIYSQTWTDHVRQVGDVLRRLEVPVRHVSLFISWTCCREWRSSTRAAESPSCEPIPSTKDKKTGSCVALIDGLLPPIYTEVRRNRGTTNRLDTKRRAK